MYRYTIALATLLLVSCNQDKDAGEALSHEEEAAHEHAAVQSTLFSGEYEYFIEYDALEAGKESGFLVHVTDLETYDPVTSGSLAIKIGGQEFKAASPERPGIFHLEVTPSVEGGSSVKYTLVTPESRDLVYDRVVVGNDHDHADGQRDIDEEGHDHADENAHDHGSSHETGEEDHGHDDNHTHAGESGHDDEGAAHSHTGGAEHAHEDEGNAMPESGEIIFLKEQAWESDFKVREILPEPFSAVVRTSGKVLAVPGQKKHLPAKSSGILLFTNDRLVEGTWVEQGEPLFVISAATLDDTNFELRYRELRNNLQNSRSVYQRHRELSAEQVIPEKQMIESRTAYTSDSLRFYNLASKATAGGLKITSPVSGYIHELSFSEGQYVQTGDQIVTISSNEKLLLRADVPMQHFPLVRDIEKANFRSAYSDRIYCTDSLNGVLLAKGSSVAENDHFIPVYFEVENDGTLLEGAYVEFYLKTRTDENTLLVPASAILEEAGNYYLYVQVSGESYTKRAITTGASDAIFIEVKGGLAAGERVVTDGVMLLKASTLVTGETGHGHAH